MKTATNRNLFLAMVCYALPCASQADAGFLVGNNPGGGGGNDMIADVLAEIGDYNAANDPDLHTGISLFKKTEDDASFVFDLSNGFEFFSDAAGTMPITTESQLTSLSTAYFRYSSPDANLLYYSVKGPSSFGFSLYTFMPGLNLLDLSGDSREMSHVSFWSGPHGIDPFGNPLIPEPCTAFFALSACAFSACGVRRRTA